MFDLGEESDRLGRLMLQAGGWTITVDTILFLIFYNLAPNLNQIALDIPSIAITSTITIITIFSTIIALSFNLGRILPTQLIKKYILYTREAIYYLTIQITFILFGAIPSSLGTNSSAWAQVMLANLIISITLTFLFLFWFLRRTDKEGIYEALEPDLSKDNLEVDELSDLKSEFNFKFQDLGSHYRIIIDEELEQKTTSENIFIGSGSIKINKEQLRAFLKEKREDPAFVSLLLPKPNYYLTSEHPSVEFSLINSEPSKDNAENDVLKEKDFRDKDKETYKDEILTFISLDEDKQFSQALDDWFTSMNHSMKYQREHLEKDFEFLKNTLKSSVADNPPLAVRVLNQLRKEIDRTEIDEEVMKNILRTLVYSLKNDLAKDPRVIIQIQALLKELLVNFESNLKSNEYSPLYASSVLYINETIRYEFKQNFEEENNTENLEQYRRAIDNSIANNQSIIKNTINKSFKNPDFYSKYLQSQLQNFVKNLQFYQNTTVLNDPSNRKKEILDTTKKNLQSKISTLGFFMLHKIEKGELSEDLIQTTMEFLNQGSIYEEKIDPILEIGAEIEPPGARFMPRFPHEKFIILYLAYIHNSDENLDSKLPAIELENKDIVERLEEKLENIDNSEFRLLKLSKAEIENTKEVLRSKIGEVKEGIEEKELEVIADKEIDKSKTKGFQDRVTDHWSRSATLRKYFRESGNLIEKDSTSDNIESFGFHNIFEKSYFIDSPPVEWSRTLENKYGASLGSEENKEIAKNLLSTKDRKEIDGDYSSSIKSAFGELPTKGNPICLIDSEMSHIVRNFEFFEFLPDNSLENVSEAEEKNAYGFFILDGTNIPVHTIDELGAVLFVDIANVGELVQYRPKEGIENSLFVEVRELKEEEKEELSDKHDLLDLRTKVSIKIFEKFQIENIESEATSGFRITKTEE